MSVRVENLSKSFPSGAEPLRGVSLEVQGGELLALLGPSGCGKTTLLRIVAGLETADVGSVHIGDRDVTRLAARERDVAFLFQDAALYPHLSVRANIAFGLRLRRVPREARSHEVESVAERLHLGDLLARRPHELSGGQRQRVALARALVRRPKLFLLDEPLGSLDASLRRRLREEIRSVLAASTAPAIYVTHDPADALHLGDRVAVLAAGKVQQIGSSREVYERPANVEVASALGSSAMNLLPASLADPSREGWKIGVRPEQVEAVESIDGPAADGSGADRDGPETSPESSTLELDARIRSAEYLGDRFLIHAEVGSEQWPLSYFSREAASEGSDRRLRMALHQLHWFDPEGRRHANEVGGDHQGKTSESCGEASSR